MATLKELSELTGLSMNTVSRAIRGRGYVSAKAQKLVRDAVRKLDYHPNKAAQALRRQDSREIAVIVDSYDALHLEKLASIKEVTAQHNYGMRVSFINEDYPSSSLRALIPEVLENVPAGVILITSSVEVVERSMELRKKLPCVLIAFDAVPGADCVYVDRYQGVYDAITYLYRKGRRRIAFCETFHSENRKRGYLQAVKDYGLPEIIIPGALKNLVLIRNTGYLNGKMFAAICRDDDNKPVYITLKLEPLDGDFLRNQYEDIIPGYYMNKVHWNSVKADGDVPDEIMMEILDKAYQVVLGSLSKKKQKEIMGDEK